MQTCYRHPGVVTGIRCQRCGRPICGACMIEAPVGFQCPECVAAAAQQTRQNVTPYGGRRSLQPATTSMALIGLNAALWVATLVTGGTQGQVFRTLALTPTGLCELSSGRWFSGVSAAQCTTASGNWVAGVADGAWWQLITSAFLHVELMHILFNMLALWFLGPGVERVLGRARFLALYLISALAGSVTVYWLSSPTTTTLGASGAVFGLMGAVLILAIRARGDVRTILLWIGANVAITVFGAAFISWQGHLGGFLGGIAVTLILVSTRRRPSLQWGALAALVALLVVATVARTLILA